MGTKIESLDGHLNSVLEMLKSRQLVSGNIPILETISNFQVLQGHDIATANDKKMYEELRNNLLEHKLKWGGKEDNEVGGRLTIGRLLDYRNESL